MADRYYLINLGASTSTQDTRIAQIRAQVPDRALRSLAHQQLHWRRSIDRRWLIAQADTDDAEHAWLMGRTWISGAGTAIEARAYLQANAANWQVPRGV